MWTCLRLEYVAQDADDHRATIRRDLEAGNSSCSGCGGSRCSRPPPSPQEPIMEKAFHSDAEAAMPKMYSLPLPRGSSQYTGFMEHPSLGGTMRVRLEVTQDAGAWSGVWALGGKSGPRERVRIELLGGKRLRIRTTSGRENTLLFGEAGTNGVLHGEAFYDGDGGGSFMLWPAEQSRLQKMLQECYVAIRSGPCVEALPHESDAGPLPQECAICLDGFAPGDFIVRTYCSEQGHIFHRSCVHNWLKSKRSCPLCRRSLISSASAWDSVLIVDDVYEMSSFLNYQMWQPRQVLHRGHVGSVVTMLPFWLGSPYPHPTSL